MQRLNINAAIAVNQTVSDRALIKDYRETLNLLNDITRAERRKYKFSFAGRQPLATYKAGHWYTRAELLKRNYAIRNQLIDRGHYISELTNIPKLLN